MRRSVGAIVLVLACEGISTSEQRQTAERVGERIVEGARRVRDRIAAADWQGARDRLEGDLARARDRLEAAWRGDPDDGSDEAPGPDPLADPAAAIACADERCTVTAAYADAMRSNVRRLAGQVRLRPAEDGLVVDRIAPGSVPHCFGFRDGDVVVSVNTIPVRSIDAVLRLYLQLRGEQHFVVDYRRDGEDRQLSVDVQPA